MNVKSNEIILLLGAGCSVEAGIPASGRMIDEIESLLKTDHEWLEYRDLYNHLKSAIHYASGLKGQFGSSVSYNIETLVVTLYELERNEDHPLYPFIATWNARFSNLAGPGFQKIGDFRRRILRQLKSWVLLEDIECADYYGGIKNLQGSLNFALRVFSLNYDLCVEYLQSPDFRVESGFAGEGPNKPWNYERFDASLAEPLNPNVYLYKLHGSINWRRDDKRNLIRLPHTEKIKPEEMEIIFGRDFKLEAADPYLFYAYEFRRCSLESKLIVVLGYGFGDGHINKILSQALSDTANRKLLVIGNVSAEKQAALRNTIELKLSLPANSDRIVILAEGAKAFLTCGTLTDRITEHLPADEGSPF